MNYQYYYNNVPGDGLCRNNLIYTSLISQDQKTFVQWYHNDSDYHRGLNSVDPELMEQKWDREVKYLTTMKNSFPGLVPAIQDIDYAERKIYLSINGVDFWQRSLDYNCSFDDVLPDWQEQMLTIIRAHRAIGLYKYSLHPSSYFIVNDRLLSINYFFTYFTTEGPITVRDHLSHISLERQAAMRPKTDAMGIDWDKPQTLKTMQQLTFESFRNNYPAEFIEQAKHVYL